MYLIYYSSMEQRDKLHIVDGSSRSRAEQARRGFDLGYHCEVYGDVSELVNSAPDSGIVLARDGDGCGSSALVVESLNRNGIWLPVVATAVEPSPSQVVAAIKSGALDFLRLPLQAERLANMVKCIRTEAIGYGESMRRIAQARVCLAKLTPREREVLELVVVGESNKQIARDLGISHRTVEVHRSSIMNKLGADRAAEVIRLRLEAKLRPAPTLKAS